MPIRPTLTILASLLAGVLATGKRAPDTVVDCVLEVGRPPLVGGERTLALARRAQASHAELGGKPLSIHPISGGGTDAGFASRSGKAVVLESLGLPGWGYHARDEYIDLNTIVPGFTSAPGC